MSNLYFGDLSDNNLEFDPGEYRAAGHVIVAIKATEGVGYADPKHRGWCLAAGGKHIAVIHYHFARPDLGRTGAEEAAWFLRVAEPLLGPHDYVVYDGERARNGAFGLDATHCADFDKYIMEHTRYRTILYASASQLVSNGKDALVNELKRDWCADYSSDHDTSAPGHTTVMRQFTDGVLGPLPHKLAGIGDCDVDVLRGTFGRAILQQAAR